jgi:hypothetical protein
MVWKLFGGLLLLSGLIFVLMSLKLKPSSIQSKSPLATTQSKPPFAILEPDNELKTIQTHWQGKKVWGYGGIFIAYLGTYGSQIAKYNQAKTILAVRRIQLPNDVYVSLTGDLVYELYDSGQATAIATSTALEVAFSKTRRLTKFALDEEHLSVLFSKTPPIPVPKNLETGLQLLPLTKWQFAWLNGFPNMTRGGVQDHLKSDLWQYASVPFGATATFRNGKLFSHQIPRLP